MATPGRVVPPDPQSAPTPRRSGRAPTQREATPRYRLTRRGKIVFGTLPVIVLASVWMFTRGGPAFAVEGVEEGVTLGAEQAKTVTWTIDFVDKTDPTRVSAALDDQVLTVSLTPDGMTGTVTASNVAEGEHVFTVKLQRSFLAGSVAESRAFSVDTTAPVLTLAGPTQAVPVTEPVDVSVSVDDPTAVVSFGDTTARVIDGVATRTYQTPPRSPIEVVAVDTSGNRSALAVDVPVALPGAPGQPPVRGVHASGWTWATPELKDPIMEMIAQGKINTVEIDLKDEGGDIWWNTSVQLAHDIGAVTELWDLHEVVDELHQLGVRVVGRVVNFRDPRLADYAVKNGKMDWVVQNPDGTAFGKYGGFTNPFNESVWEYNIAVAEDAAKLGVDDILYDYVRRPDDYIQNMRFPGAGDKAPEDAIIGFLESSRTRIHAAGARLGASVFGIAASRPDEVAQDIPRMSTEVDYIAPMVYPSHWGPGEYGVKNPNSSPYDIVYRSLEDFHSQMEGTGAELYVWLQDFSLGVDYGPAEVRAQIDAAADAGVDSFFLWDAATTYHSAALDGSSGG